MGGESAPREANLCKFVVLQQKVPNRNDTMLLICLEKIKLKPMDFDTMSKKLTLREATLSHQYIHPS